MSIITLSGKGSLRIKCHYKIGLRKLILVGNTSTSQQTTLTNVRV
jgi:hypothetical protein